MSIGWTQYDVPFVLIRTSDVFHDFSFHGYEQKQCVGLYKDVGLSCSTLIKTKTEIADVSILLDLIFFVRLSTFRKFLVLLALSYLIILFQVVPDWVNEVLRSSLHHTCMNQKTKIRWFDTQLETRENLPFRFSGYRPIIINPIKRFIIHSKYFPNSDWLKAHA